MTRYADNLKELYACERQVLTVKDLNDQYYEEEMMVQARMVYLIEDFNSFATIRLLHKPEQTTYISLLFVRKKGQMDKIRVAFGYEDKKEQLKVNPNEETNYATVIIFD